MSDEQDTQNLDPQKQRHDDNDILEEQEHKGFGEDEGEREQALDEE
jgi:hypothetical protein